jgi:hypothetical protein
MADRGTRKPIRVRLLLIGAAALSLLLVPALSVEYFGGADFANAAVQKAKSFLELIQQRSPGHRTKGQLVKIKHRAAARPHERALPKVVIPAILPPGPPERLIDIVAPPIPVTLASVEAIPIPPLVGQTPLPPGILFPPPSLIVPPTETPTPTPPIVTPPITAVPEPDTWMTMLLGFGFIGWQLRWRRRQPQAVAI